MTNPGSFAIASTAGILNLSAVRRNLAITCLFVAWLCANGAVWNVVQVLAWVKMIHDYSQVMPAAEAVAVTFDGSKPCALCHISQKAQDAARDQLPRDAASGGAMEKILLLAESAPAVVLAAPDSLWPGIGNDSGLIRTEPVPVRPPRV